MDDIVSRAIAVANSQPEFMRLKRRLQTLAEMQDRLIYRAACHRGECDECHRETIVTEDTDTTDCGEFVLCLECVRRIATSVHSKIRRIQKCSKQ